MPVSINNTTLTFNDATTQTTSGVTAVNVSTGISSTGGKTPTLTNTGVTSVSGAGTVSVSASTGGVTITGTGGSGTVTSVATGNGLQGGTITSTGTLSVACPTFNTVGSYCFGIVAINDLATITAGANYSAGTGANQVRTPALYINGDGQLGGPSDRVNNLSGSWKWMGCTKQCGDGSGCSYYGVLCRVS